MKTVQELFEQGTVNPVERDSLDEHEHYKPAVFAVSSQWVPVLGTRSSFLRGLACKASV